MCLEKSQAIFECVWKKVWLSVNMFGKSQAICEYVSIKY